MPRLLREEGSFFVAISQVYFLVIMLRFSRCWFKTTWSHALDAFGITEDRILNWIYVYLVCFILFAMCLTTPRLLGTFVWRWILLLPVTVAFILPALLQPYYFSKWLVSFLAAKFRLTRVSGVFVLASVALVMFLLILGAARVEYKQVRDHVDLNELDARTKLDIAEKTLSTNLQKTQELGTIVESERAKELIGELGQFLEYQHAYIMEKKGEVFSLQRDLRELGKWASPFFTDENYQWIVNVVAGILAALLIALCVAFFKHAKARDDR